MCKKLALVAAAAVATAALVAAPGAARADLGIGVFVGAPTGLDVKIGLQPRSALDLVFGWHTYRSGRAPYGHATYLYTLTSGRGRSVLVPIRIGLGAAVYGSTDDIDLGVRVPLELALRFRRAPVEIYGEIALLLTLLDSNNNRDDLAVQGGVGLRMYF